MIINVRFNRLISPLPMGWVDEDERGAREKYDDAQWILKALFSTKAPIEAGVWNLSGLC